MFFLCLGEDQNVVQIDHHNTLRYEVPEDVVHHGLEGGRTVSHSKERYQGLEQTSIGPEGCLPLVSGLNADVVRGPLIHDSRAHSSTLERSYSRSNITT